MDVKDTAARILGRNIMTRRSLHPVLRERTRPRRCKCSDGRTFACRTPIEAIELIRSEMMGVTLQAFEPDKPKRWLIERGIEIISEASRHLPHELKARDPEIPWAKVAGIGNVLRHDYEHIAHDVLWRVVLDDLGPLEKVCREELAAELARGKQKR